MAFKIKSAKILTFFLFVCFGIKEHTVMLLSVGLSDLRMPSRLQDINRKRKRGVPASCRDTDAPDEGKLPVTWRRRGSTEREGRRQSSNAGKLESP